MIILKQLILYCAIALFGKIQTVRGQEINRLMFFIADSTTKKPIVGALVSCKARLTYTMANKQGQVSLIAAQNDSIYIEMQNYAPKKIRINDMEEGKILLAKKKVKAIDFKEINGTKKITLNEFNIENVKHYVGFPNPFNPVPYQQIAQRFYNPGESYMLDKITIAQLFFDNLNIAVNDNHFYVSNKNIKENYSYNWDNSRVYNYMDLQSATFRLRIYCANDAGYPAEDLCNEEINVVTENSDKIVANLSKYKIIVPKGGFFVAIQWLPNIENASQIAYDTFSTTKLTGFKPFVGIVPAKDKGLSFFVKDYSGNWQKSADKGKLAIALTGRTE